ncbi:MAG: sulfite exporter TauE/SafE family protein [Pikeienuella sp.]
MEWLGELLSLPAGDALEIALIVFIAGLVRGFAGFALTALVMAGGAMILPPVQLLPVCWFLELTASALMTRGGIRAGERDVALWLVVMSALGQPVGYWLTTTLPVETSRLVALSLVVALALAQLVRLRLPWLATRPGLMTTGALAGLSTGLAGVGGMVVALYVLARNAPAAAMRGTLVLFLVLGSITGLTMLSLFGLMTAEAATRGLILAVPAALGVVLGARLFTERLARWYRLFCLALLVGMAATSLMRAG